MRHTGALSHRTVVNLVVIHATPSLALVLFTWDDEADAAVGAGMLPIFPSSGMTPTFEDFCTMAWMTGTIDQQIKLD